jgi:hypothetical protein
MGQPVTLALAGGKSLYRPDVHNSINDFATGAVRGAKVRAVVG